MAINTTTASAYNSSIAISTTAQTLIDIGFSAAEVKAADVMRLTVEAQPVRYRYDGTAPTAAEGHPLIAAEVLILTGGENLVNFQIIRSGATDAEVRITLESL